MKDELLNFISQNAIPLIAGTVVGICCINGVRILEDLIKAKDTNDKALICEKEKLYNTSENITLLVFLAGVSATGWDIGKGNSIVSSIGSFALSTFLTVISGAICYIMSK